MKILTCVYRTSQIFCKSQSLAFQVLFFKEMSFLYWSFSIFI